MMVATKTVTTRTIIGAAAEKPPASQQGGPSEFDWYPTPVSGVQTLPEQIAARISDAIFRGNLLPGQRIPEQHLSDEFEVSRGPIREALRLLERDGLVVILARRGAQVTDLTFREVRDIFDIRAHLLYLAMDLACRRQDPNVIHHLNRGVNALQQISSADGKTDTTDSYVDVSYRLSLLLAEASGNERLKDMLFSLAKQTRRYTLLGLSTPQRRKQSARTWKAMLKHVKRNEPELAAAAARSLVIESRDMAMRLLEEKPAPSALSRRADND
jgi:DNA-binding GntR family transcriptional regulator